VYNVVLTIFTTRCNVYKFYVLPTQFICVFCVDQRTNSDYFTVQIELVAWYIRLGLLVYGYFSYEERDGCKLWV
jgi:hypothetical protein